MCAYIYCSYKSARADKAVISFLARSPQQAMAVRACVCVCFRLEAEAVWLDRRVTIKPSLCL